MVFADNCWPAFNEYEYVKEQPYSLPHDQPQKTEDLLFAVGLTLATGPPVDRCPTSESGWEPGEFPPIIYQLDSLDGLLEWGRGITDADRLMVYKQLDQLVQAWEGQAKKGAIKADAAKLRQAHDELSQRIAALEGRNRAE
jgi:hypothetical protein